jgi:hypothetical protein
MNVAQLTDWHNRLKLELSIAYADRPWHGGRIDRIADDRAFAEQAMCRLESDRVSTFAARWIEDGEQPHLPGRVHEDPMLQQ